ncbi:MAG: hypothetical protein EB141_09840 [Verrucomicrobia bacterium]|nr:hypothetical protein [Verrucomicrobiota bacterium]NBU09163.1 hypothetical protein [Pseudomonadota bacterium]NDA65312.1 hypothetical protein [Verrucomicrobiota bacterium]NDB75928.1 hypothetical protein [Verrucomicrobiota bacterium]NDD37840.1 hypothetical protein [Verrucomicrobiota bacterium]
MKVNQWTIGLAAAGVISFGAVAQADEKPTAQVLTAVSSTVLSGYVSTSVAWNPGKPVLANRYSYAKAGDQFSLDVVDLKLSSALAEGEFASGYNVELWLGPDAAGLGNVTGGSSVAIKNANVALNIPVGNGLQAKIGVFDTIVGYESANSIENPNYTRSAGYTIEPTSHTGLLLSYKVCEAVSVSAGVANTYDAALNAGARGNNGQQTYLASISVTAPESFGFLKGAVLTAGVVDGFTSFSAPLAADQTLIYVGATIPTGIDKLNLGVSWDHLNIDKSSADQDALAGYISYKLTDKATLNTRVEYARAGTGVGGATEFGTATLTLDYKLWANVVSRVEYRLDHDLNGARGTTVGATRNNSNALIGQVAYKF